MSTSSPREFGQAKVQELASLSSFEEADTLVRSIEDMGGKIHILFQSLGGELKCTDAELQQGTDSLLRFESSYIANPEIVRQVIATIKDTKPEIAQALEQHADLVDQNKDSESILIE